MIASLQAAKYFAKFIIELPDLDGFQMGPPLLAKRMGKFRERWKAKRMFA